jgi:hypothetical protein
MAVAFDGEAVVQQTFAGGGPFTWAGKTTAGSNRVGLFGFAIAVPGFVDAITWGGSAMTLGHSVTNPTDGRGALIYYIINPPTASSDVVLTLTAVTTGYGGVMSFNGAHQSSPIGATAADSGTADPATVTIASAADALVVDALYFLGAGTPPSVGAGQTERYTGDQGTWFGTGSTEAGAASVTMSWTLTSPTRWSIAAVSLAAVAGAFDPTVIDHTMRFPAQHRQVYGVVASGMTPPNRFGS